MHLSLWYKHLSLEYTIKILQNNLSRLPKYDKNKGTTDGVLNVRQAEIEKFIREEYVRYSKFSKKERGPWNGRQIRNAVQIASSLALYEKDCKDEDDGLPATLTADHFRSVASTMFEFEEFLRQSRVGDDTFHAKQRQERHDDFQSQDHDHEDEDEGSTYQSFREASASSYRESFPRIDFDDRGDNQGYGDSRRHGRAHSRDWTNDPYPRNSRR